MKASEITDRIRLAMHRPSVFAPVPRTAPQTPQERTEATKCYDHHPDPQLPDAEPKEQARALDKNHEGEAPSAGRPLVRFTLRRVRLLDADAKYGSIKDLLDGLQFAGLVRGDKEEEIILEVRQEKVGSFKEEKTVIEITT